VRRKGKNVFFCGAKPFSMFSLYCFHTQGSRYCIVLSCLPVVVVVPAFFEYCCWKTNMTQGIDSAATDFKYIVISKCYNVKH